MSSICARNLVWFGLVCSIISTLCSAEVGRWEDSIHKFEAADTVSPPPKGATVFVGSSSFTLWTSMEKDFFPYKVINRGFGGAKTSDLLTYIDRIILPYSPEKVVFYCGGNDLSAGVGETAVIDELKTFVQRVHANLPNTDIYILSIKPSPLRMNLWEKMQAVNTARKRFAENTKHVFYVDISKDMFNESGMIREDIFLQDRVHMNAAGYQIWINIMKKRFGWSVDPSKAGD